MKQPLNKTKKQLKEKSMGFFFYCSTENLQLTFSTGNKA